MKDMEDYDDLDLKADVLLLAHVFEEFRNMCSEYYGLDLCHYFSSLRLSWDAWREMNGVKLDFLTVVHTNHFIEKGMRGRVFYVKRYSKANNKPCKS